MANGLSPSYDLIVIGGGPAGSNAARAAAQREAKVLLIDQKQRIGLPVQCAELVSKWISHHVPFASESIIQSIETMVIHLPDSTTFTMKSPGYMLDRSLFDKSLVTSAILAGVEIWTGAKAIESSSEGVLVKK